MIITARAALVSSLVVVAAACAEQTLTKTTAVIKLTPLPVGLQQALADPTGLDYGPVPLNGLGTARFRIDNLGGAPLELAGATIEDASGGTFTVVSLSERVVAFNLEDRAGVLEVSFAPAANEVIGEAVVAITTNAGPSESEVARVRLRGVGLFVGSPNLEVCYGGQCYPQTGQCSDLGGRAVCTLPTLDFGNVPLESFATAEIRLRNVPAAGTCLPPPGSPECTPVCRLVFDRDPAGDDLGFGFTPAQNGFELVGNINLPFLLEVPQPQCGFQSEQRLLINFLAGTVEGDQATTLVIESNDPDAATVRVPLTASSRVAPIAVAELLDCATGTPPLCTPDPEAIRPLERVYLTGRSSYDQSVPPRPLVAYAWQVVEWPPGANPADFGVTGADQRDFSAFLPLAGPYRIRLRVANDLGIQSGVSATSDVVLEAIPDSRVHVQLVWDHPSNDMDLHVTHVESGDLVCAGPSDCFWDNCKLACLAPEAECRTAPEWFLEDPIYDGANPRLDIDDTNGLGPENTNIDAPRPSSYRIYVHYYTLVDRSTDPTQATVRVYIDGALRAEYRRRLQPDQLWRVGQITWYPDDSAFVQPATTDGGGVGAVKTMYNCSSGFAFGSAL